MMPKDKLYHLGLGCAWVFVAFAAALVQVSYGIGPAVALSTTAYAILYELNQWYRKEGQPEVLDAVCTALPGLLFWAFLEMQ